ncbi:MAG: flagellar biosynthesis repressor FlbT [Pseudomonadota bacterium]
MPLRLRLRPDEKIAVNGAVVSGNDKRTTTLVIHNHANILRGKDVLLPENVDTPVKRAYYLLQLMYLDSEGIDSYLKDFNTRMTELRSAIRTKPLIEIMDAVDECVQKRRIYNALTLLRLLLKYEAGLLEQAPTEDLQEIVAEAILRLLDIRKEENDARLQALEAVEKDLGQVEEQR